MSTPADPVSVPLTTVGGSSRSPQGTTHGTSMVEEDFNNMKKMENDVHQNNVILGALKTGPPFAVDIADFMIRQEGLYGVLREQYLGEGAQLQPESRIKEWMYRELKFVLDNIVDYSDVNKLGTQGFLPLHVAVRGQRVDDAELLLACGADPNIKSSSSGKTPLEELERMMLQDPDQIHLPMYEVFEFDTLAKFFPDETLSLFTLNKDDSSNPPLSMAIPGLQKGSVFSSESFWLGLGQSNGLTWIHVNSTNGIILAKLSKAIEIAYQQRAADPFPPQIAHQFCRMPLNAPDHPGDPLLRYKQPFYTSEDLSESQYRAIVFPCLILTSVKYHQDMRRKIEEMSDLFPLLSPDFKKEEMINHFPVRLADVIHLERTLDEAYYPGLGADLLERRNTDQVVSRACSKPANRDNKYIPVVIVPQLWLWQLENYVVSAFASGDTTAANRYFHSSSSPPEKNIRSPQLRIGLIIASRIKAFGAPYENEDEGLRFPPTLSLFETAVVSILTDVDEYMRTQVSVDVKKEAEFIHVISDIRDELFMIQDVLNQQAEVLKDLLGDERGPMRNESEFQYWREVEKAEDIIRGYRKRTQKIDGDAARMQQVIQDKLNLKRTDASMKQAVASIKEARESKLLSLVVIGFTIITLIFTPLSFLAGLFALDIDIFSSLKYTPVGGNSSSGSSSDVFSGGKMAGIFIGVEILTILITAGLTWGAMNLLLWALKTWHWDSDTKSTSEGGEKDDESKRVGANLGPNSSATTGATVGVSTATATKATANIVSVQDGDDEKQDEPEKNGSSFRRRFFGAKKKGNASGGTHV